MSNIKFHVTLPAERPTSFFIHWKGGAYGWVDGRTDSYDLTKPVVGFRNCEGGN